MDTKSFRVPVTLDAIDKPTGSVSALFSVFNKRDDVGDVVLPSFFTDGQPIPMAAWGHAWESLPPGSGVIRVTDAGAVFDGQFFDTHAGQEHYKTVKALGPLQEWSFGFKVTEAYDGEFAGQPARFLKAGLTFEASPVLVGANRDTRTMAIKGRKGLYVEPEIEGSYEDVAEDIAEAMTAQGFAPAGACVCTIATFSTYAYVSVCPMGDMGMGETTYYRVEYTLDDMGDPVLSAPTEVEPGVVFTPSDGLSFAGESMKARAAVERLVSRTSALAALRAKSGRVLSAANHAKLTAVHDGMAEHLAAMQQVLKDHAPQPAKAAEVVDTGSTAALAWQEVLRFYDVLPQLGGRST